MKVSIIGGGGLVGSSAAFALQCGGIVSQIDLIDLNADQVRGQALDLLHGASLVADQRIRATGYEAIPESDVIVITAGLRRKPDESRLDLINRNVELFLGILVQATSAGIKRDAIVLVVSNPVDVLTYLAVRQLDLPPSQVIGLGTQLDTARADAKLKLDAAAGATNAAKAAANRKADAAKAASEAKLALEPVFSLHQPRDAEALRKAQHA